MKISIFVSKGQKRVLISNVKTEVGVGESELVKGQALKNIWLKRGVML